MTVEECFHRLMQMRETTVCQLEDEDYADVLTHDTDVDVFNMAIEALEKQIPKEPKIEQIKYGSIAKCPTCDKLCYGFDYCIGCGQRMNWSDNNE